MHHSDPFYAIVPLGFPDDLLLWVCLRPAVLAQPEDSSLLLYVPALHRGLRAVKKSAIPHAPRQRPASWWGSQGVEQIVRLQ